MITALLFIIALALLCTGLVIIWAEVGFHRKPTDWFLIYIPKLWHFFQQRRFWIRARIIFRWYDFYIGIYFHQQEKAAYVLLVPMVGVRLQMIGCWCWQRRGSVHAAHCPYWRDLIAQQPKTIFGFPVVYVDDPWKEKK